MRRLAAGVAGLLLLAGVAVAGTSAGLGPGADAGNAASHTADRERRAEDNDGSSSVETDVVRGSERPFLILDMFT